MNGEQAVFASKHEDSGGCGSGDTTQRDELLAKINKKDA